ncbi:MAG: hypothetical protein OWT27_03410 [Firmicutes bacterium]|nr:hypothetical protein [Bacillota bacterium]
METLDPALLHTFRQRIAHPVYWRRTYAALRQCNRSGLGCPEGCAALVDHLSGALNVPLTPAQRAGAVAWLHRQRINPNHPGDVARMWSVVQG